MLVVLLKIVVAYLLGSLSGSLMIGRWQGIDIRAAGSGNAGGTNALRTRGWRFALGVVAIDIGKGVLAALLGWFAWVQTVAPDRLIQAELCSLAAIVGHVWPVFFGFRGGKGAATLVGAVAVLSPTSLLPSLLLWLLLLSLTGYVGLATVAASLLLPLWMFVVAADSSLQLFAALTALLIIFTHRGNLLRLRRGVEPRFERARILLRLLRRGS
ncbi:MAG: glycerol-3-phosphate 1-O-acyltransferase PlsY [Tahibacter sp.]